MLNQTGIKKETYGSTNQILFNVEPQVSVGIVVDDSVQATANSLGKKIVKAGTPLTGDLTNRLTPFTAAKADSASEASDAVGVLLHDVDVTTGDAIFGFVNLDRIDETTQGKLTSYVKAALAGRVTFLK